MRDQESVRTVYASGTVEAVNARQWSTARWARHQARRPISPAEAALLSRHREQLRGDVLELGCAGGELTTSLSLRARSLVGLSPSAPAIAHCRGRHPEGVFLHRDFRELDTFDDGSFDAVVAGNCALDVLGHAARCDVLAEVRRVLADDGVFIFSSHCLESESLVPPPERNWTWNPVRAANRLVRLPRAMGNRARLGPLQEREHGYGILNCPSHDYTMLHYHVSRDGQERQLAEHGLSPQRYAGDDVRAASRAVEPVKGRSVHHAVACVCV